MSDIPLGAWKSVINKLVRITAASVHSINQTQISKGDDKPHGEQETRAEGVGRARGIRPDSSPGQGASLRRCLNKDPKEKRAGEPSSFREEGQKQSP